MLGHAREMAPVIRSGILRPCTLEIDHSTAAIFPEPRRPHARVSSRGLKNKPRFHMALADFAEGVSEYRGSSFDQQTSGGLLMATSCGIFERNLARPSRRLCASHQAKLSANQYASITSVLEYRVRGRIRIGL